MKWISLFLMSCGLSGVVFAQDTVVISATKMNVFYRGLENPVEIAVPGVPQEKVEARIDGEHKLSRQSDGSYIVVPNKNLRIHEANITVTAELPDGTKKSLPPKTFRVKRIPDPSTYWTGKTPTDKYISKSEVMSFAPVAARMERFDFDLSVRVASFTLGVERQGMFQYSQSDTNRITEDMQSMLRLAQRGDRIWIGDVLATMPDGTQRELRPLLLTLID